jgi:hypothetical protein
MDALDGCPSSGLPTPTPAPEPTPDTLPNLITGRLAGWLLTTDRMSYLYQFSRLEGVAQNEVAKGTDLDTGDPIIASHAHGIGADFEIVETGNSICVLWAVSFLPGSTKTQLVGKSTVVAFRHNQCGFPDWSMATPASGVIVHLNP